MQCYINMQKDYSELGELIAMVTGSPVGVVTVHSLYGSWLRPSSTTNLIWEQNKQAVRNWTLANQLQNKVHYNQPYIYSELIEKYMLIAFIYKVFIKIISGCKQLVWYVDI